MKIGIDLGTTFSLCSTIEGGGQLKLIPDNTFRQDLFTPSIVHLSGEKAYVGRMVEPLIEQNPELETIRFFKRKFGDPNPIFYDSTGTSWYPEAMGALVLKKLKFDAEGYSGQIVDGAVITIPAHFNDPQRRAVLNAAAFVDMPVLGLVEEPVAAALHYGVKNSTTDEEIILVYDLGGGTFDVTLLTLDHSGVYVLAKDGLTELGGKEFDEKIADIILQQYQTVIGTEPDLNAKTLLQLRRLSEEVKIELCMPGQAFVNKTAVLGGVPFELIISRKEFENSINEAIDETEMVMQRCITGSGLAKGDITSVLLVGGSSMVPLIKERVRKFFDGGNQKILFHEPMKAVASGAAVHVCQLSGDAEMFNIPAELRGVTGYHIGLRTIDPRTGRVRVDPLIKKNIPLPIQIKKTYYTTRPDQTQMIFEFVQYLDDPMNSVSLGNLVVGPFSFPQSNYPVEITINYQEDGTVMVVAYDPQTGEELSQSFGNQDANQSYLVQQKALVTSTIVNNIG